MIVYKNKTPVISRSFNHQSKNEQLIRLLFTVKIPNIKKWYLEFIFFILSYVEGLT